MKKQIAALLAHSLVVQAAFAVALAASPRTTPVPAPTPAPAPCAGNTCAGFTMTNADLNADLALLEKLVNMPSETNDIAGVSAVSDLLKTQIEGLGFSTVRYANPELNPATGKPISADMMVAEVLGKKKEFITFIVHMDTVFKALPNGKVPVPYQVVSSVPLPDQIPIGGDRIVGSGVGDNKGGVVMLLRTLKMILARGTPNYSLRVIFSSNEEVGSPGHKTKMGEFAPDSVAILSLEPSSLGDVLSGRGAIHWYEVTVKGVEGHAAIAHERGVNACLDLSIKLAKASQLTDYSKNILVNVGTITGGKRANIICGEATAVIDTRFPDMMADLNLERSLTQIFTPAEVTSHDGLKTPSVTTWKTLIQSVPYETTPASAAPLQRVLQRIQELDGFKATPKYSRAGADISYLKNTNAILLDGMGPVTDGSHTANEYIVLNTMRTRALVLADLVTSIP